MGARPAPRTDGAPTFVIQEHHATRLHYDFRLERDGVLVSWAVPKNVPTDPGINHLAVHVEDHPVEYGSFEGTIPKGEYGAGTVSIWDKGIYDLEKWRDDEVILTIHGEKHGSVRLALIRTGTGDDAKNWMMHRTKDQTPHDYGDLPGAEPGLGGPRVTWTKRESTPSGKLKPLGSRTVVGSRMTSTSVHPMLATLGDQADFLRDRVADDWAYEMKWDGYRAIATVRGDEVTLRSRNGLDLTPTFPELTALADATTGDGVFDGEIVALDGSGRPNFERLQQRSGLTAERDVERARKAVAVKYFVFDLLETGGTSTITEPYTKRRRLLRATVKDRGPIVVPPDAGADVEVALRTSRELGLEGVMAKRKDSPYRLGKRSRDWIKLKHLLTQEVVVGGWRPGTGRRSDTVGSLLLGIPEGEGFRYIGRVGTGFTDRELMALRSKLDRLSRATSPLSGVPAADARDAHWVTPSLVGEVEYAELTGEGRLRQPAWRGWRPDKGPKDVVLELPN